MAKINKAHELLCLIRAKQIEKLKSSNDFNTNKTLDKQIKDIIKEINQLDIKEPKTILPVANIYQIVNNTCREFSGINDRYRSGVLKSILETEEWYFKRIPVYNVAELITEISGYIGTFQKQYDEWLIPKSNSFQKRNLTEEEIKNRKLFEAKANISYLKALMEAIPNFEKGGNNASEKKEAPQAKKDMSFLELFKHNEDRVNSFFSLLTSPSIEALDKNCNWIYNNRKGSIVACFEALAELGYIKPHLKKAQLRRIVKTKINFEGSLRLFNDPYNQDDYNFFFELFKSKLR